MSTEKEWEIRFFTDTRTDVDKILKVVKELEIKDLLGQILYKGTEND
jgi:hypothetical protein